MCLYLPYIYALPGIFGKKLTTNNIAKTMATYSLGEAGLTFGVGYLMDWFHPMAMFVFLFIIALFIYYYF